MPSATRARRPVRPGLAALVLEPLSLGLGACSVLGAAPAPAAPSGTTSADTTYYNSSRSAM